MIEIYNSAGVLQCSFPRVLSASLCDKLSGERTLSFSVLASRSQPLSVGMTAKLDGQFYSIVRVSADSVMLNAAQINASNGFS